MITGSDFCEVDAASGFSKEVSFKVLGACRQSSRNQACVVVKEDPMIG